MAVEYTGRHTTVTVKLKKQAEAGLEQIGKLVGKMVSVHVILTVDKYRHIAEITVKTAKHSLVATCEAAEMAVALHDALARIEQQAIRFKQKRTTVKRHPKTDLKAKQAETEPELSPVRVVRSTTAKEVKPATGSHSAGRKPVPMSVRSQPADRHLIRTTNGLAARPMSVSRTPNTTTATCSSSAISPGRRWSCIAPARAPCNSSKFHSPHVSRAACRYLLQRNGMADEMDQICAEGQPECGAAGEISAFGLMLDLLPCMAFAERDGCLVAMNILARNMTGCTADGRPIREVFLGAYEVGRGERRLRFDSLLIRRYGRPAHVSCAVNSAVMDGNPCRIILAIEQLDNGLRHILDGEGSFLEDLLDASPQPTVILHDNRILHVNRRFSEFFGYSRDECIGDDLTDLIVPDGRRHEIEMFAHQTSVGGHASMETVRRTRSGEEVAVAILSFPIRLGGEATGFLVAFRDIRLEKIEQARLKFTVLHDALTGLPNRSLYLDRLKLTLARLQRRPDRNFSIFFIDLDGFKEVNDTLGHAAGDALLLIVGERLKRCVRPQDTVARFGGDEFALIVDEIGTHGEMADIAQRIQAEIGEPVPIEGAEARVTASIGIALGSTHYDSPEAMMRDADHAMYEAKMAGKARHTVFSRNAQNGKASGHGTPARHSVFSFVPRPPTG